MTTILALIITGLIVGLLGRLALPGKDPIGIVWTILLGIAGALIAGLVAGALGLGGILQFILAIIAAALLLMVFRKART